MGTELTKTQQQLRQDFEENRIQFVLTELDTAITFCELALSSSNPEKTRRNVENACIGYKTALRMANKANLWGEAKEEFDRKIWRVQDLLKHLGREI
jgi:hypothetical protein